MSVPSDTALTSSSWPLNPLPNPSTWRSYACLVVVSSAKLLSSWNPSRKLRKGIASTSSRAVAPIAKGHGRRWITRLHRYAIVSRRGRGGRCGTSRLSAGTKKPSTIVINASANPIPASAITPSPSPTSPSATKPEAVRPRQRVCSILLPAKPSRAGRSVTDASTVTATVTAAVMPRPPTNPTPISSMPSKEMATVAPANTTERPAVSIAMPIDSRISWPAWSCSR